MIEYFNIVVNFLVNRSSRQLFFRILRATFFKTILLLYACNPATAKMLSKKKVNFEGFIPHQCDKEIVNEISSSSLSNDWKLYKEPISRRTNAKNTSKKFTRLNHRLGLMTLSCMFF